MNTDFNLNTLKYFVEVASTKNITKASENLNVSQPALTKALHNLESDLNSTLFVRSKKGVSLTDEGEILYNYAKTMFQSLNNTINAIDNNRINEPHLYIGATTTNFLEPIIDSLRILREKYPNVKINIVLEEIEVLEMYNKLDKLDIIIINDYESIDGFIKGKSFSIQDKFIASKKYFNNLSTGKYSLKELLDNYPFVLLSNITHGRKNFDAYLKSNNIIYKPTYEFNSYSLCRELIRNGFGIGIGNPIHYNNEDFIIIDTSFNLPKRDFSICYKKNSTKDVLKAFVELINKD